MGKYAKFIAAILATVLAAVVPALADQKIGTEEWVNIAIIFAGAAAVLTAPNIPGARYTKAILAVMTAVLTLAVSLISDGLTAAEVIQMVIAALGAIGVATIPNSQPVPESVEYLRSTR